MWLQWTPESWITVDITKHSIGDYSTPQDRKQKTHDSRTEFRVAYKAQILTISSAYRFYAYLHSLIDS